MADIPSPSGVSQSANAWMCTISFLSKTAPRDLVVAPTLGADVKLVFDGEIHYHPIKDVLEHAAAGNHATWLFQGERRFNGPVGGLAHKLGSYGCGKLPVGAFGTLTLSAGALNSRLKRIHEELSGDAVIIMLITPPASMCGTSVLHHYAEDVSNAVNTFQRENSACKVSLWVTHPVVLAHMRDVNQFSCCSVEDGISELQNMLGYRDVGADAGNVHVKLVPRQLSDKVVAASVFGGASFYPLRLNSDGHWTVTIPAAMDGRLVAAGTTDGGGAVFDLHVDGVQLTVPWLTRGPPDNNSAKLLDIVRHLAAPADYSSEEGQLVRSAMLSRHQGAQFGACQGVHFAAPLGVQFGSFGGERTASAPFAPPS